MSCHVTSCHITSHRISYHISYYIISYHSISYNILLFVTCKYSKPIGRLLITWDSVMLHAYSKYHIDQSVNIFPYWLSSWWYYSDIILYYCDIIVILYFVVCNIILMQYIFPECNKNDIVQNKMWYLLYYIPLVVSLILFIKTDITNIRFRKCWKI